MSRTPSKSSAALQDDSPQVHVDIFVSSSEQLFYATSPEVRALGAGESPEEAVEEFAQSASDYIQHERENDRAGLVSTSEDKYKAWLSYLKLDNDERHSSCNVPLKLDPPANTAWIPIQEALEWADVP